VSRSLNPITIYRNWRAQKRQADQIETGRKSGKLFDRREFLTTSISLLGGIGAAFISAGCPLVPHLRRASPPNIALKNMALSMLKEIQTNKSMSPRYKLFVKEKIRLIEADKITFVFSKYLYGSHRYREGTNRVEINRRYFSLTSIHSKAPLIHELFHAYQDYNKTTSRWSIIEAKAYLAEYDYLHHHSTHISPESWIHLFPAGKFFGMRFNVPRKIGEKTIGNDLPLSTYEKAVKTIAEHYLWIKVFFKLYFMNLNAANVKYRKFSRSQLKKERAKLLHILRTYPSKKYLRIIKGPRFKPHKKLSAFIATSRILIFGLWKSGKRAQAEALWNKTFLEFKTILQPLIDLSPLDKVATMDGIE
jgi:hypothetical protein